MSTNDWSEQVLHFWFDELDPNSWFRKDERVDALIREMTIVEKSKLWAAE